MVGYRCLEPGSAEARVAGAAARPICCLLHVLGVSSFKRELRGGRDRDLFALGERERYQPRAFLQHWGLTVPSPGYSKPGGCFQEGGSCPTVSAAGRYDLPVRSAPGTACLSANQAALVYPTSASSSARQSPVQDDLLPLLHEATQGR